MSQKQFDIVVLGAGIVGLSFACALADSGLNIAVVEGREADVEWPPQHFEARVSAITRASQHFFNQLSCWQRMQQLRVSAYTGMYVWDEAGQGAVDFSCQDIAEENLGHIIENKVIQMALLDKLQFSPQLTLLCPHRATALKIENDFAEVTLDDASVLQTKLIVAADGANSSARDMAGFTLKQKDYGHSAIVTTVVSEKPHQSIAWQRFLSTGPLAFLPLNEPFTSSIVWSADHAVANDLMSQEDETFKKSLACAFEMRLGEIKQISRRFSFPLSQRHVDEYVKPRIALIGDAAHTIHPLAGQGVNLGIADAKCLASLIKKASAQNRDFSQAHTLRRYARWRRAENQKMMVAMAGFKKIFTMDTAAAVGLRSLGLDFVNKSPSLKKLFIKQAMA